MTLGHRCVGQVGSREPQVERARPATSTVRSTAPGQREPAGLLGRRPQLRVRRRRQPAVDLVERTTGAHRGERGRERALRGRRVVDVVRRHHLDTGRERELGQRVVAVPVERITVIPELDEHPVAPEGLDEPVERAPRAARGPSRASAAGTVPLRHPVSTNQWSPVPRPELLEGEPGRALLAAHLRLADRPGEARVAGRAFRQHHEVLTGRVGAAGLGAGVAEPEGELGAEDGGQTQRTGRLGEAHDPVEPVVVGDRERASPRRAASSTSSSGWLAPSRKEKFVWQCSSA